MKRWMIRVWLAVCVALLLPAAAMATGNGSRKMVSMVSLADVNNTQTAVDVVRRQIGALDKLKEQIGASQSIDLVTRYAENAISSGSALTIEDWVQIGSEENAEDWLKQWVQAWNENHTITINNAAISRIMENRVQETLAEVEKVLSDGNVKPLRGIDPFITFKTSKVNSVLLSIDPDIILPAEKGIRYIRVETKAFIVTFNPSALAPNLEKARLRDEKLLIQLEDNPKAADREINITIPDLAENEKLSGFFTLSIPVTDGDPETLMIGNRVTDESDSVTDETKADQFKPVPSMFNPVISTPSKPWIDAEIRENGVYMVTTLLGKTFTDVEKDNKITPEQKQAIQTLNEEGLLGGFPDGTFRPNEKLNRGQFVWIIMEAIGQVYQTLTEQQFSDLPRYDEKGNETFCFYHANTACYLGILGGYKDGTFRRYDPLSKQALCKIVGNVLANQRGYELWSEEEARKILKEEGYTDVDQNQMATGTPAPIALLVKSGVIISPKERGLEADKFNPRHEMTRAEMAEIISKFVEKLFP